MIYWKNRIIEKEVRPAKMGLAGRYKLIKYKRGIIVQETDWFDNLILDAGLNRWGTGLIIDRAVIGTNNVTPTVSDTQLASFSAATTNQQSNALSIEGSSPYRGTRTFRYRFAEGALNGTYAEVGVGWGNTTLWSRALIQVGGVDGTITVLSDETLDVVYELRCSPPLTDVTGTISISGTSYDYTLRAASVTSSSSWGLLTGAILRPGNGVGANFRVYSGAIGTLIQNPSGSADNASSINSDSYSNNSLQNTASATFGLNQGNFGGGVQSFGFLANSSSNTASFQVQFDPVIPKDNTKILTLNCGLSWDRL